MKEETIFQQRTCPRRKLITDSLGMLTMEKKRQRGREKSGRGGHSGASLRWASVRQSERESRCGKGKYTESLVILDFGKSFGARDHEWRTEPLRCTNETPLTRSKNFRLVQTKRKGAKFHRWKGGGRSFATRESRDLKTFEEAHPGIGNRENAKHEEGLLLDVKNPYVGCLARPVKN